MNTNDAHRLAKSLMVQHNVGHYAFRFDGAKRRFGQTSYSKRVITLSRPLTETGSVERVTNTILHEIAHAIVGPGHGHGPEWVRVAKAIGCDGKRCSELPEEERVPYNWKAVCPSGCVVAKRYRRPSATKRHSCPKCSPVFDPRFLIRWVPA